MVVTEVLQFADRLVFAETGKHLDDIQKAVVKGVWQKESYEAIAKECHRSESRVRDVGYKLWQILSERLEEDVNKSNFRATIERLNITSSKNISVVNHQNFKFCSQNINQQNIPEPTSEVDDKLQKAYIDLGIAPKITHFEGRSEELEKLSEYILNQPTRIMAVLGLGGIGKTTLVRRFIDLHSPSMQSFGKLYNSQNP